MKRYTLKYKFVWKMFLKTSKYLKSVGEVPNKKPILYKLCRKKRWYNTFVIWYDYMGYIQKATNIYIL